jgi:HEAT repeat protein
LRNSYSDGFAWHLLSQHVDLEDDNWSVILSQSADAVRWAALDRLPVAAARRMLQVLEAQLAHADQQVRMAACRAMQRSFGAECVPQLLTLVQDPDDVVRKQARESLEQLKQEHEQRTFWAAAKSGIDTSSAGAAAKLLTQAKAGEPKEQRLLAIHSLAVLAAAESLPYLIDATKDQDADIAAAARTAIAQIHAKSGTPEPVKK